MTATEWRTDLPSWYLREPTSTGIFSLQSLSLRLIASYQSPGDQAPVGPYFSLMVRSIASQATARLPVTRKCKRRQQHLVAMSLAHYCTTLWLCISSFSSKMHNNIHPLHEICLGHQVLEHVGLESLVRLAINELGTGNRTFYHFFKNAYLQYQHSLIVAYCWNIEDYSADDCGHKHVCKFSPNPSIFSTSWSLWHPAIL